MARLFVALVCDNIKNVFQSLQLALPSDVSLTTSFHITLKFLDEINPQQVPDLVVKLQSVKFDSISVCLSHCGVFPNQNHPRVAWVGIAPQDSVIKLANQIHLATPSIKVDHEFFPHITLARFRESQQNVLNFVNQKIGEVRLSFDSFVLFETVFLQGSAKHVVVKSFSNKL